MAIGHPKELRAIGSKGRQAPIRWLDGRPDIGRAETRPGRGDRQEKQPKVIPGEVGLTVHVTKFDTRSSVRQCGSTWRSHLSWRSFLLSSATTLAKRPVEYCELRRYRRLNRCAADRQRRTCAASSEVADPLLPIQLQGLATAPSRAGLVSPEQSAIKMQEEFEDLALCQRKPCRSLEVRPTRPMVEPSASARKLIAPFESLRVKYSSMHATIFLIFIASSCIGLS